jgi:hypothetical protein
MSDAAQSEVLSAVRDDGTAATIRRRHVIYVSGYDPRGAQSFFDLLRRTCERFGRLWPIAATLQAAEQSEQVARWQLDLHGADWQVTTRYDFLRMENFIRADMGEPTLRQFFRGLGWYADDIVSGAQFRIFRAAWRFALHLLYFQLLITAWAAAAVLVALALGRILTTEFGLPLAASVIVAIAAGAATLFALRVLAARWRVVQIASCWSTLRRFGRGRATWIDRVVEIGAQHLVAAARAGAADEVALVGHSTGGAVACAIMARALELDPELGRRGPRVVLLTLGSVMPAVALHPAAQKMRGIVARLAVAPAIVWIDCQSRKDVMCFANFDPVAGIGIKQAGAVRCNPLLWHISFKEMIAPQEYDRFRWSHFRVHYQYIMAGDRPAPYDYVLLVGGPKLIAEWPQRDREFFAAFRDGAAVGPDLRWRDEKMVGAAP